MGLCQNFRIFLKIWEAFVPISTGWSTDPRIGICEAIRERGNKGVRTMDRTTVRCYHDGIPGMGVPMAEGWIEKHVGRG